MWVFSFPAHLSKATGFTGVMMAFPSRTGASRINIDLIAVAIALTLAALIRFNVLPPISF